jgi:hypothetical protein
MAGLEHVEMVIAHIMGWKEKKAMVRLLGIGRPWW